MDFLWTNRKRSGTGKCFVTICSYHFRTRGLGCANSGSWVEYYRNNQAITVLNSSCGHCEDNLLQYKCMCRVSSPLIFRPSSLHFWPPPRWACSSQPRTRNRPSEPLVVFHLLRRPWGSIRMVSNYNSPANLGNICTTNQSKGYTTINYSCKCSM